MRKATWLVGTVLATMPLQSAWAQELAEQQDAAQEAQEGGLNVIVVTATKREKNLQDVPVSVTAVSGDVIAETGVRGLQDLSTAIPNFSIQQDPIGDKINIRGIQSGNNAGLEQSVGTFVDGVYRGRGVQSRFAFLDVGLVEVLRGPQGTLFGKNTIGGALNITSAKPTNDLSAAIAGTYTFDNVQEYELNGHVSGPLSDFVRVRLAGQYRNLDEGYVFNAFYGTRDPQLEEAAGRLSIEADLSDTTVLSARVEYGDFDLGSQPFSQITPGPLALFGVVGPPQSFSNSNIGATNPVLDIGSSGTFSGDTFEAALTLEQEIGDHDLTVILANSAYDFLRECDCDFSPTDIVRFDDTEDFEQTSLEVRLTSPQGEPFEYILGAYYQDSSLFADGLAQFGVRAGPGEIGVDTLLAAGCAGAVAAGADPATNRSCILDGLVTAFDGTPLAFRNFGRLHLLDQDSELFAVFGEATIELTEQLSFTGGLRYANEKKEAVQSAFPTDFGTSNRNDFFADSATYGAFGAPDPFTALAEGTPHTFNLSRTENAVTWSANLAYQPNPDVLLYVKAGTGFKAGGFNSFALSADPAEAEFEEETVIGGEIGGKFTVFNGDGEINFAAFYSEFDDIQTALFTGSTSFIVQNAAKATSKGIEIDSRFAIGNNLQINAAVAYVDFSFDSFPNAGCTVDQLLAFRISTGNPLATTQTCSQAEVNDLAGRPSENTPEWSGTFGLTHELPIGTFLLTSRADVEFASSQFRQADLDPEIVQDGYAKVNLVLTFGPDGGNWDLSLIAKNLFDEQTFSYGNDTPLVDTARQFIPDRPRTIGVRARLKI